MSKGKRSEDLWKFLENSGALERGNDTEIKAVKRTYRKKYLHKLKQLQRARRPEFIVGFKKDTNEYYQVLSSAKKHNLNPTSFIRVATLAYINKTFVVKDREQIIKLEYLLSECLNSIQKISSQRERFNWDREQKLEAIEKHIEKLEKDIGEVLRNPPPIEIYLKEALNKNPQLSEIISGLITDYARKNPNP